MVLDWYSFNVFTLAFDIVLMGFSVFALFITFEERKKTKRGTYADKRTTGTRQGRA